MTRGGSQLAMNGHGENTTRTREGEKNMHEGQSRTRVLLAALVVTSVVPWSVGSPVAFADQHEQAQTQSVEEPHAPETGRHPQDGTNQRHDFTRAQQGQRSTLLGHLGPAVGAVLQPDEMTGMKTH